MRPTATVVLRAKRERPVQLKHPWIFSGAIAALEGRPTEGAVVDVRAANNEWLARGTWSSTSQIRVRLCTWDADEEIDQAFLGRRIARALAGRGFKSQEKDAERAERLIYAESDGLPGLIVDRYGRYLVLQLLTQGMALREAEIVELLAELVAPLGIYERSIADVRAKEGLPPAEGLRWGEMPPAKLSFTCASAQQPLHFLADLQHGQKTGFYLDQALNRLTVAAYCQGKEVLDAFCYSGGFTLYAAQAGASKVTAIDSSAEAFTLLQANLALNELSPDLIEPIEGDVFQLLRQYRFEQRSFDLVILDPPKFAHSQAQLERATRGYKDINLIALQLLRPGGILATFSCSGLIMPDLFQKIVFGASLDAQREVQVVERLTQAPDHPVLLTFPEGEYLKGLICRVW